jgi:hypothetical protein
MGMGWDGNDESIVEALVTEIQKKTENITDVRTTYSTLISTENKTNK